MNVLFVKLMGFDRTLFSMHDVMVWISLAIYNSDVLHVEIILPFLKNLGEIKCCVRFSVPRDPIMTLSPL